MQFDREIGCGVEIFATLENGKAWVECRFRLQEEESDAVENFFLEVHVLDGEDREILRCTQSVREEEPLKGLIIHPHLWQGLESPYLYKAFLYLTDEKGEVLDEEQVLFPVRSFREVSDSLWMLNEIPFPVRAVAYHSPRAESSEEYRACVWRDFAIIRQMGANTICIANPAEDMCLCGMCEEYGFVVWQGAESVAFESLMEKNGRFPSEQYFIYKAHWSLEPFIFIAENSLRYQKNGSAQVMVYSNADKVALYVNGILHEFGRSGPVFLFQEVPTNKLPLMLTAEAGECIMSVTAYPHR